MKNSSKLALQLTVCLVAGLALSSDIAVAADSEKKAIASESDKARLKDLPFSPAILKDGTLYCSGQVGFGPNGRPENFEDEVKTALDHIGKTLGLAGYTFADVVTVTVYLTDMDLISKLNAVYPSYFPEPRPARTTVGVAKLVSGARIEITVMAKK
jgi:2-iminobutanoate/2-iminopropanoate deaminase